MPYTAHVPGPDDEVRSPMPALIPALFFSLALWLALFAIAAAALGLAGVWAQ